MSPEHSIVAQLINLENGTRSKPVTTNPEQFAKALQEDHVELPEKMGIIIIMEKAPDQDWDFSYAPFLDLENFIKFYSREATDNG